MSDRVTWSQFLDELPDDGTEWEINSDCGLEERLDRIEETIRRLQQAVDDLEYNLKDGAYWK